MPQRPCFPVNHFTPTLSQRRKFYSNEFNASEVERWLSRLPEPLRNPIYAVDVGTETNVVRRKYRASMGKLILFTLPEVKGLKDRLSDYCPEDVYYDRNLYEDKEKCLQCKRLGETDCSKCTNMMGQHIMFDVDPENIDCPNCGTLAERIERKSLYQFCFICFKKAAISTRRLYSKLVARGFKKLETIYSGRGFHIYIEDADSYELDFDGRVGLSKWAREEQGIPIDPWVTRGGTRFARLPYSLHGLVCKIVTPIDLAYLANINPSRDEKLTPSSLKAERNSSMLGDRNSKIKKGK